MTPTDVVIVGAGGFGREVLGIMRAADAEGERWRIRGFVTRVSADPEVLHRLGVGSLGDDDAFLANPVAGAYVAAVGDPAARRRIVQRFDEAGLTAVTVQHPTSIMGEDVELADGVIVGALASATTNVRLAPHVHLDRLASVGHDVRVGAFTTIHPGALVMGYSSIAEGARIGAGAVVMPGVHVGAGAVIGAGAVVTRSVADGEVVAGVPARILRSTGHRQ